MICDNCEVKDKEITRLKGVINFHTLEALEWRALYEKQRGGVVFDNMQKELVDLRVENIRLRNGILDP